MKAATASQELTRLLTAYLTSIAFGLAFLVATLTGVDGLQALWRSVVVGAIALVAGHLLAPPVVDTVLAAIARDEVKRKAADKPKEDA
jgi:uncharacterized membrane protein YagU involved in acid resistance